MLCHSLSTKPVFSLGLSGLSPERNLGTTEGVRPRTVCTVIVQGIAHAHGFRAESGVNSSSDLPAASLDSCLGQFHLAYHAPVGLDACPLPVRSLRP